MGSGTLIFQLGGQQAAAYVSNAASKAAVELFAQDLHDQGYTHAAIPRVSYTETSHVDLPASPADMAEVGMFANVLVRRASDGKLYGILIHAPNLDMFEAVIDQGYRVKHGDGVAIAAMYSDLAGEEFSFYDGWLQGSSLRGNLAFE